MGDSRPLTAVRFFERDHQTSGCFHVVHSRPSLGQGLEKVVLPEMPAHIQLSLKRARNHGVERAPLHVCKNQSRVAVDTILRVIQGEATRPKKFVLRGDLGISTATSKLL